jgi:hypothetical protein
VQGIWLENLKGIDNFEELGKDGRIISDWILRETGWADVDWIHLTQERDQWQTLMNMILNLWVP